MSRPEPLSLLYGNPKARFAMNVLSVRAGLVMASALLVLEAPRPAEASRLRTWNWNGAHTATPGPNGVVPFTTTTRGRVTASFTQDRVPLSLTPPASVRAQSLAPMAFGGDVSGLLARRSLNPTRFDYYHPFLGPWLASLDTAPAQQVAQQLLPSPTTVPSTSHLTPRPCCCCCCCWGPNPRPQGPPSPQVPEPTSALILLGLFGAAAWARHWRHSRR